MLGRLNAHFRNGIGHLGEEALKLEDETS
jgi:hypothetical protein